MLTWTFCFPLAKTFLLVPDFYDIRINVIFPNALVSLVWIFQCMFPRNGSFIVVRREVWFVAEGSHKQKIFKQIKKHHFCTTVWHTLIVRLNLCVNSESQIAVVTKSVTVEPRICGSLLWKLLYFTHLGPIILEWFVGFWKMYAPMVYSVIYMLKWYRYTGIRITLPKKMREKWIWRKICYRADHILSSRIILSLPVWGWYLVFCMLRTKAEGVSYKELSLLPLWPQQRFTSMHFRNRMSLCFSHTSKSHTALLNTSLDWTKKIQTEKLSHCFYGQIIPLFFGRRALHSWLPVGADYLENSSSFLGYDWIIVELRLPELPRPHDSAY
jgi:hypothetical protein